MSRLKTDLGRCVGSGMCALTAPELFDQDPDDGRVILLKSTLDVSDLKPAEEAIALCPAAALSFQ